MQKKIRMALSPGSQLKEWSNDMTRLRFGSTARCCAQLMDLFFKRAACLLTFHPTYRSGFVPDISEKISPSM